MSKRYFVRERESLSRAWRIYNYIVVAASTVVVVIVLFVHFGTKLYQFSTDSTHSNNLMATIDWRNLKTTVPIDYQTNTVWYVMSILQLGLKQNWKGDTLPFSLFCQSFYNLSPWKGTRHSGTTFFFLSFRFVICFSAVNLHTVWFLRRR